MPSSRAAGSGPDRGRIRVLFIGEGSSLAHAARPMALASALPAERFDVRLAVPERYHALAPAHVPLLALKAQTPEAFERRLTSGRPLFTLARLEDYARQDAELMAAERPDVVVGDLRLSLAASAREAGVPYIALSNAYWSPDRPLRPARPSLDLFRGWPGLLAEAAFRIAAPRALKWHARQVDRLLQARGLEGIGEDVRRAFTEADLTFYADIRGLLPDVPETPTRRFLGPVAWQPPTPEPDWWQDIAEDGRPLAYVTLGSSGEAGRLGEVCEALAGQGYSVMAATAGRVELTAASAGVHAAAYLPGLEAARRAALVICNGGSPTVTQALIAGRPVLGIVSNMDQMLNMRAVEAAGAGLMLRADALDRRRLSAAIRRLGEPGFTRAAQALSEEAGGRDPAARLGEAIEGMARNGG